jgi:methyl-accepting chemotaxis protein
MFRKLSLGTRLTGAFVIAALICAIVGVIGIVRLRQIAAADRKLYEAGTAPMEALGMLSTHFHRMRANTLELVTAPDEAFREDQKKRILERRQSMAEHGAAVEKGLESDEEKETCKTLQAGLKDYYAVQDRCIAMAFDGKAVEARKVLDAEGDKFRKVSQESIEKLFDMKVEYGRKLSEANTAMAGSASTVTTVLVVAGVASSLAMGIFLSLMISGALNRVTSSLSEGAEQVTSAAGQISSSSQSLAEGSSEQAASLEETASSMEEMSAMTRRNTESAEQAKKLSDQAGSSVDKANASMTRLMGQMGEISSTGEEIGKIIKTIDEISFQTNLLALNAAVEAARAGEAGAGFAVVADEVRNLAQRAAGAAKSTSELIEATIRRIKDGTELVERTNADFSEVTTTVKKVTDLVAEVAAASMEQTRGIAEVSSAVSQMDKVTQCNAASAEETASASEELSAQAVSMEEIVRGLETLVSGEGGSRRVAAPAPRAPLARRRPAPLDSRRRPSVAPAAPPSVPSAAKRIGHGGKGPATPRPKAEDVIPFDDPSIEDF